MSVVKPAAEGSWALGPQRAGSKGPEPRQLKVPGAVKHLGPGATVCLLMGHRPHLRTPRGPHSLAGPSGERGPPAVSMVKV